MYFAHWLTVGAVSLICVCLFMTALWWLDERTRR